MKFEEIEVVSHSTAVDAFCAKMVTDHAGPRSKHIKGEHIRLDNSHMTPALAGGDYVFVDQVVPIMALCPDMRLMTLLCSIPAMISALSGIQFATLGDFRLACTGSRTLTREIQRVMCDEMMPLILANCHTCSDGVVLMKSGVPTCSMCNREEKHGLAPTIIPNEAEADGINLNVEAMVVRNVVDDAVTMLYEVPYGKSTRSVVDTITFDSQMPAPARGMFMIQAFVRK